MIKLYSVQNWSTDDPLASCAGGISTIHILITKLASHIFSDYNIRYITVCQSFAAYRNF